MRLRIFTGILLAVVLGLIVLMVTSGSSSASRPAAPTMLTAVVDKDGPLAYGVGAVSSRQVGADGSYEVTFDRDVSRCAYVAAAGDYTGDSYAGPDDAITMGAAPRDGNVNAVYLIEFDAIGDELGPRDMYSSGFHLIVVCP